MTYENFKSVVVEQLTDRLIGIKPIEIKPIPKNNGIVLDGMLIGIEGANYCQTYYLNNLYADLEKGKSIEEIIDDIERSIKANNVGPGIDIDFFKEFDNVKDKLIFKIVNRELNSEYLETVPHVNYLDMAVIFCCYMEKFSDVNGVITITNEIIKLWNVDTNELFYHARINTPKLLGVKLKTMADIVKDIAGESFELLDAVENLPMYVATNQRSVNGASVMLYENFLKLLAETSDCNLVVIPSSIHELIIIPTTGFDREQIRELKSMVYMINRQELVPQDILSDNVYFFSNETKEISIA